MVNKLLQLSATESPESVRYLPKKNRNIYPHKDSHTSALFALFIEVQNLKCQPTGEQINKSGYTCHRIQFSNKKKPLLYEITWMNLKNIMLSEGNWIQISIYCLILFVCNSRIGKVYCNRKQIRFCL